MAHSRSIKLVAALIVYTIQVATCAKNNARPVYEVVNEQARMDDIRLSSGPAILPYGNPLAGNSAQNARLHVNNQQAMFNAERIRQHKAQLQRLTQGPPIIDSYMKAYHESQESHQLALEQQQATIKDDVTLTTTPVSVQRKPIRVRVPQNRLRNSQSNRDTQHRNGQNRSQLNQRVEFNIRTHSDTDKNYRGSVNRERSRNHRSYDSIEYQQYLLSKEALAHYGNLGLDEGVTIKPNGNVGLAQAQKEASSNSQTVTNPGKYIPKNVQNYQAMKEINALELLLKKNPNEQLSEFKSLINSAKDNIADHENLYYYINKPTSQTPPDYRGQTYTQIPSTYASNYLKDYTPVTEDADDVKTQTETPALETSTIHTNYYKVEVASQTLSSSFKPSKINEELLSSYENPSYEKIHYGNQPATLYKDDNYEDIDGSNLEGGRSQGIQHLGEDGIETSAYGDENLHYAANYEFGYRVRDVEHGNFYGQYEAKTGRNTKGHYHVLLPDGRMQKVSYSAGPSGYHADISYDHLQS